MSPPAQRSTVVFAGPAAPDALGGRIRPATLILFGIVLLGASLAPAELAAAPPKVNYLFPAGGQRGQSVTVTAAGEFGRWPARAWADRPGVAVVAEQEKGKFRITVAENAAPGIVWLRFSDEEGAAGLRPWAIGELPEILEAEPNDTVAKPQPVALPATINGRLEKSQDVDGYAIALNKGETLVAAVQAHTIFGAPLDGILQVCELAERRPLALEGVAPEIEAFVLEQNHDAVGLDPRIVFVAPRAGRYLVRFFAHAALPTTSLNFAGGDDYVYRLTLTTSGLVEFALPLALATAGPADLHLHGPGLPPAGLRATLPALAPSEPPFPPAEFAPRIAWQPQVAGSFALPAVAVSSLLVEPTARPAQPQSIQPPVVLSGLLAEPKQVDAFRLSVKKGDRLWVRVESRSLGLPLDGVLTIADVDGNVLVENDDSEKRADPSLLWTAPRDGEFTIRVRDLHRRGGPRMAYRLTIAPEPEFKLSVAADAFAVPAGGKVEIPVTVQRRPGMNGKLRIRLIGLPAGFACEEALSDQGESAKAVKLVVTAPADAQPGGMPLRVEGSSEDGSGPGATATFPLELPLAEPQWAIWLTVPKP